MGKFRIRYALGGGFGGCENSNWEEIECANLDLATEWAWESACEEYDSYGGMHGLRDIDTIMDEEDVDYNEAKDIWVEERESWLEYEAEEIK